MTPEALLRRTSSYQADIVVGAAAVDRGPTTAVVAVGYPVLTDGWAACAARTRSKPRMARASRIFGFLANATFAR